MPRSILPHSLLVVFGPLALAALVACVLLFVVNVPAVWNGGESLPLSARSGGVGSELRARLHRPITVEYGFGPSMTLGDALEFLSDRYDVPIDVDVNAFAAIGVAKVKEQPVQLPGFRNVSLGTVLRLLLNQIKGDVYVGTYHIRDGRIEVTTTYHTFFSPMMWAESGRPHLPSVSLEARGQAIDEALLELADHTGIPIILDPKVHARASKVPACSFKDVPLDTAVQLLADQADAGVAIVGNVLHVTDRQKAQEMQAAYWKRLQTILETPDKSIPVTSGL